MKWTLTVQFTGTRPAVQRLVSFIERNGLTAKAADFFDIDIAAWSVEQQEEP